MTGAINPEGNDLHHVPPIQSKLTEKIRKRAKIRNRYNQAPHLPQDTNGKVTTSQLDITNESQDVSPFPAGPGPAQYLLPSTMGRNSVDLTKRHSPAFSFGSRSFSIKSESPGPAYAIDPSLGPKGKENTPSYSFGARPKTPGKRDKSPGPGAYNTDMKPFWEKNAPKYSMSPRNKMRHVDPVPSPLTYNLPTTLGTRVPHTKGGPATSISGKSDYMSYNADLAKSPGPAYYSTSSPNLVKRRSPEFTLKGRNFMVKDKNPTPGPGSYDINDIHSSHMPNSPRHVIGVRHSEFKMPVMTLADISN